MIPPVDGGEFGWPQAVEADAMQKQDARRSVRRRDAAVNCIVVLCIAAMLVAFGVMLSGCATPEPAVPVFKPPVDPLSDGVLRRAVVVGLTKVDPVYYGGWDGDCPGCDVDAGAMALLCHERGLEVVQLLNEQATKRAVQAAIAAAADGMTQGSLLVVYASAHGGQVRDQDGDEQDGQDETICLWDGQLTDDVLAVMWTRIPAGVRVLFVTDTCNSGTNYRGRRARYKPRKLTRTTWSFSGQLIHFGGCADGESSFGSASGGAFTTALIDAWDEAQSYREWYDAAARKMGPGQAPVYAEYGTVTDDFRNREALR